MTVNSIGEFASGVPKTCLSTVVIALGIGTFGCDANSCVERFGFFCKFTLKLCIIIMRTESDLG